MVAQCDKVIVQQIVRHAPDPDPASMQGLAPFNHNAVTRTSDAIHEAYCDRALSKLHAAGVWKYNSVLTFTTLQEHFASFLYQKTENDREI
jgi:hypothetical protein